MHSASPVNASNLTAPNYPRQLSKRICHLGVGNFHRAHQAWYLHRLLQQGDGDGWGLCGIALMPADQRLFDALERQDGLYSLWQLDSESSPQGELIGSIMERVNAIDDRAPAHAMLCDADTRIVSLTITEKGYCLNRDGQLDTEHPVIARDLATPDDPQSAVGLIVAALASRRAAGIPAFTVMSCDNLQENGHKARQAILDFARQRDSALEQWIRENVSFPLSMVDRITPVPTQTKAAPLKEAAGFADEALLYCEPFAQWVLEDHFVNGRPAFENVGVTFTDQVPRFEAMKVGLLNGGHSVLSHRALLAGFERVHDAAADSELSNWLKRYWAAVTPSLAAIEGVDFQAYQATLLQRFRNGAIEDQLLRLGEDTSSKFQQCLLPALRDALDKKRDTIVFSEALGFWIHFLATANQDTLENYRDTNRNTLIALAQQAWREKSSKAFLQSCFPPLPDAFYREMDQVLGA